jgi:hypothetical protein
LTAAGEMGILLSAEHADHRIFRGVRLRAGALSPHRRLSERNGRHLDILE